METNRDNDYDIRQTFSARLRFLLNVRGVTILRLAEATGTTRQSYTDYLAAKRLPSPEALVSIARFLDVSVDYLLGTTDIPTPDSFQKVACEYTGLTPKAAFILARCLHLYGDDHEHNPVNRMLESDSIEHLITNIYRLADTTSVATSNIDSFLNDDNKYWDNLKQQCFFKCPEEDEYGSLDQKFPFSAVAPSVLASITDPVDSVQFATEYSFRELLEDICGCGVLRNKIAEAVKHINEVREKSDSDIEKK